MSVNMDKLVKFLKSNPEASQKAAADNQGLTIGQLSMQKFCVAKVEAGIATKLTGTPKQILAARNSGERWELIAARAGISVAEVKSRFQEAGGKLDAPVSKPKASGGSSKKPAAKKGGTQRGATGRQKPIVRNRNRRGAGNPS